MTSTAPYRGMFYNNPSLEMVHFALARNQGYYLSQDDLWLRPPKPPRGVPRTKKRYRRTDSDPGPRDVLKILTQYRNVPNVPSSPKPETNIYWSQPKPRDQPHRHHTPCNYRCSIFVL